MKLRTKAELILFATTFIWGSTFIVLKSAEQLISPFVFVTIRFTIGAAVFAAVFNKKLRSLNNTAIRNGTILGILLGVGIAVQNYGLQFTTASKSAFITGMMVIFTPLAQMVIEKRMPTLGNIVGIVLVSIGLFLLTSPASSGFNIGDAFTLFSAFLFGIYIVYLDIFAKKSDVYHLTFVQIFCSGLIALCMIPMETARLTLNMQMIAMLLYMGILATIVTTYSQSRFQKETTPTRAVIIFTIEPVISAVLAYFVLGEMLGRNGILGGIFIIAGILISELFETMVEKFGWKISIVKE